MDRVHPIVTGLRIVAWSITGLLVAILTSLSGLFLACSNLPVAWARYTMAIIFVAGVVALFVFLKPKVEGAARVRRALRPDPLVVQLDPGLERPRLEAERRSTRRRGHRR
jgi:hypothetical protein